MLKYAIHAYAWTTSWSNDTLDIIDHAKELGFDIIEIPLMEIEKVDPKAIKQRLEKVGIDVCTSTACSEETDITSDDPAIRQSGIDYLKKCVQATHDMGATCFSGVIYSAIGRKLDNMPTQKHWQYSADALKQVAQFAAKLGITIGLEPVNRYETFLVNTCDQAIKLKDMINEPNVKIHLDSYHMNIEETDFYTPTKKATPFLCHYHLSESHRGTPGTGVVNWNAIYKALAESGYQGVVGMESFIESSDAMRAATCIWRPLAESSDKLLSQGLEYLKKVEKQHNN